jgi:hypothetical protein
MVTPRQPPCSTRAPMRLRRPGSIIPALTYRASRNPATAPARLPQVAQTIPQGAPNRSPATIAKGIRGINNRLATIWTPRNPMGVAGCPASTAVSEIGSSRTRQRQAATAPATSKQTSPNLAPRWNPSGDKPGAVFRLSPLVIAEPKRPARQLYLRHLLSRRGPEDEWRVAAATLPPAGQ